MSKKILTIHSEDRDINKWPNPNHFELTLPDNYKNIKEINLLNFNNTNNFYNISEFLLNNYLQVSTTDNIDNPTTYIIPNGFYSPDQLAFLLTKLLNDKSIKVLYDSVQFKFLFISNQTFHLHFDQFIHTDRICDNANIVLNTKNIADQYSRWGIGYNLGFRDKKIYYASSNAHIDPTVTSLKIVNEFNTSPLINNLYGTNVDQFENKQFIYSDGIVDLNINNTIYMEIDNFNNNDEIVPYQYRSNYLYCNDYATRVNSFFAKILLNSTNNNNIITTTHSDGLISFGNIKCNKLIDKLTKLKFKFRYHNNVLVDFNNINFNFTLEFVKDCN
tara:strand:- start:4012 stop:5004 length:993 start_codon:yes stop_codon:yes gene_type:complete